jgi:hypothetical protein
MWIEFIYIDYFQINLIDDRYVRSVIRKYNNLFYGIDYFPYLSYRLN